MASALKQRHIEKILYQLRCMQDSLQDLVISGGAGEDPVLTTTQGGSVSDTLQSSLTASLSTGALPETDKIRLLNIISETDTMLSADVTLADGSSFTHSFYGGGYNLELSRNQSPITEVTVTELDDVSTRVTINYLSH